MDNRHAVTGLAVWLLVTFSAAGFGSLFTPGDWYGHLAKPSWTPPDWVFGPVWTVLYACMAVSAWLIWKRGGFAHAFIPLTLFLIQLVLNAAWSWFFFGLKSPGLAFGEIVVLWSAVLLTVILFWRENMVAGILLIPYLGWSTFALALNFSLWRMNI